MSKKRWTLRYWEDDNNPYIFKTKKEALKYWTKEQIVRITIEELTPVERKER